MFEVSYGQSRTNISKDNVEERRLSAAFSDQHNPVIPNRRKAAVRNLLSYRLQL